MANREKEKSKYCFGRINRLTILVFKADVKYKDMFKPTPQTEDQHTSVKFPRINTNAIDRILHDSDDEDDSKAKLNILKFIPNFSEKGKKREPEFFIITGHSGP